VAATPPRLVLSSPEVPGWRLASDPVPTGSNDWQSLELEFMAPSADLVIAIGIEPRFSYEKPTTGTVWFDDFSLRELAGTGWRPAMVTPR
jgi:hypothetical protein